MKNLKYTDKRIVTGTEWIESRNLRSSTEWCGTKPIYGKSKVAKSFFNLI